MYTLDGLLFNPKREGKGKEILTQATTWISLRIFCCVK
jgi:hypothetical protein